MVDRHGRGIRRPLNILAKAEARVTLTADGHVVVETDHTDIGNRQLCHPGSGCCRDAGPADRAHHRPSGRQPPAVRRRFGGQLGRVVDGFGGVPGLRGDPRNLAQALGCASDDLLLQDGKAWAEGVEPRPVTDLLSEDLTRTGKIEPGKLMEKSTSRPTAPSFCEVAVNAFTGETRLRRMTGAFGFGRVLNAKTARSQCLGGMVWGIGSALTEELSFDSRDGHLVNHDLAEYHVPVHADIPDMEVILLEERDPHASPIQAKGVGELGICGAAGAVANAIYNACGVRLHDFPMTPDKLLAHLPDPFAPAA